MASHVPTILSKHYYLGAFYSLVTTNMAFHNNPSYSTTVTTVTIQTDRLLIQKFVS